VREIFFGGKWLELQKIPKYDFLSHVKNLAEERIMKIVLVALMSLAISAMPAAAACKKKDLQGTWELYGQVVYSTVNAWLACTMDVNKKGNIAKNSPCLLSIGMEPKIPSGKLKVKKNCAVTGNFDTGNDSDFNIQVGQMNSDKTTMSGAGDGPYGAWTFTAVKK
jgi:hypothetical protein